ncbi:hypothetical protein SAMN05216338_10406 [Bradyrhizobium sp. Rc2d]|uniref:hypothetical protein n=1 Tax=Bradyrhizobium sp. Rc2d TaxID=1855321 RepID=UPI000885A6A8|nr:hypothetical protein [Bradyrhizobium sp. Rc2d]SDJ11828.1 hypothetical protein SAMN05216338_10406 [Bradyrhizobium sp. Rc2d]
MRPEVRGESGEALRLGLAISRRIIYLLSMFKAYELCLATAGVPNGPDWIHEVKHDGYRMLVIREDKSVRLLSRNGLLFARPAQHLRGTRGLMMAF